MKISRRSTLVSFAVVAIVAFGGVALTATVAMRSDGTSVFSAAKGTASASASAVSPNFSPAPTPGGGEGSRLAHSQFGKIPATSSAAPSPVTPGASTGIATGPATVITIGDSIMRGSGLGAGQDWPALLAANVGWNVINLSCGGAGFLAIGDPNACASDYSGIIASMIGTSPDIIIICGSSNDFGQDNDQLAERTTADLALLRRQFPLAQIIALSTVWSESEPPAQLADIDSQVRQAVGEVNGTFIDIGQPLGGYPELMQADDVHPTAAGQVVLESAIEAAIAAERDSTDDAMGSAAIATSAAHPAPDNR